MSEKLHQQTPEHHKPVEHHEKLEQKHLKELQEKANNTKEVSKDSIEAIKHSIESTAISGKEYNINEKEVKQTPTYSITKHVKKDAYKRVLQKTQKQLTPTERIFSKTIHNSIVEKTSDISAKTIARPSGILFGGIGAFIGSLTIFFISKYSGFTYNYLLFLLIFIGSYFIGLIVELIYKTFKPKKS